MLSNPCSPTCSQERKLAPSSLICTGIPNKPAVRRYLRFLFLPIRHVQSPRTIGIWQLMLTANNFAYATAPPWVPPQIPAFGFPLRTSPESPNPRGKRDGKLGHDGQPSPAGPSSVSGVAHPSARHTTLPSSSAPPQEKWPDPREREKKRGRNEGSVAGERRARAAAARYLVLVDALDGDAIAGGAVDGGVGVSELAVSQQLAERVPRLEVLVVAEVRPLAAGHDPAAPLPLPRRRRTGAAGAGRAVGGGRGGGGEAEAHLRRRRLAAPAGPPATINGTEWGFRAAWAEAGSKPQETL